MSEQLKPCPFCGGKELSFQRHDIDGWISYVQCGACDGEVHGPDSEYKYDSQDEADEDAAQVWNRRADDPQSMSSEALAAHIAELQKILKEKQEVQSW
jgi:Lar family restriction alleviation protein